MKFILTLPVLFFVVSCGTYRQTSAVPDSYGGNNNADTMITQSLFNDKNASISEENIQKLLDGNYKLPQQLRVAVVRLDKENSGRRYYYNDEDFLKTQQSYLDSFTSKLRQSPRVQKVSVVPEIVVSKSPSFTQLREAAVRLQSDIVVVYSISSDIYSRYKIFSNPDLKAFATTQLIVLDVRTGMVPFSTIVTKDQMSKKTKSELDNAQATARVQHEAVLMTIDESSTQMLNFLKME